jgi:hypothetical protein
MQTLKAGILVAAVAGWVTAQDPGPRPPRGPGQERGRREPGRPAADDGPGEPPPPPPFGPPLNPLFQAIDADGDGELSSKEIARAPEAMLKLDRNKDGALTEDEVRPPPPPGPPGAGRADPAAFVASVLRFDKDGDGKVTAQELPDRMARLLEEGDTNGDKALNRSEIEALSRRPPPRRPGPPDGGPPPPPPGRRPGPPPAGPGPGPDDR